MFVFPSLFVNAQITKDYLLEVKQGFELGEVQQTVNPDQTLTLAMANTGLANDLNQKQLFVFKKAFAKSQNPKLQRVYFLTVSENTSFSSTLQRAEIEKIIPISNEPILTSETPVNFGMLPNDFEDIITGGRNTMLDLIKAPLAWSITTGDPNVVIGVVDSEVDLNHEDLQGSIIETVVGTDQLKLYWAKANTTLYWPEYWDGTMFIEDPQTQQDILMGDEVGTLNIPVLEPGQSKTIEFEWDVPNPQDYVNINSNPWHFCLLARILSPQDPMAFSEVAAITQNVKKNNNIVWKNTTVVDILPNVQAQIGGVVAVANPYSTIKAFNLQFIKDSNETGPAIYEEAEVSVEMDDMLYDAWVRGGMQGQNFASSSGLASKKRIATGNNMVFNNILFDPNEIGTAYVAFNFLTSQVTPKKDFTYHAILRDATTNEIIGGETYEVHKKPNPVFEAEAGSDQIIERSESVTITAAQINGAAQYNWHDPDGNLIYTGTDLTVSPEVTKTYRLEIIRDADGYKDYDEVEVTVNPYKLESLVPNPATDQVAVNYIADEATSAYLMVVSTVTGISNNYILDVNETDITLNVSSYPSGLYSVALVCDGVIVDSKNLAKQ